MMNTTPPPIGTVMLIDDEEVDQMLYSRIIERSRHAQQIVSFLDAEKALDYLASDEQPRPDLILLDINMPNMNGFEFLDKLDERMGGETAPVIFLLTTSFDPRYRARADDNELVRGFVQKPLTDVKLGEFRDAIAHGP